MRGRSVAPMTLWEQLFLATCDDGNLPRHLRMSATKIPKHLIAGMFVVTFYRIYTIWHPLGLPLHIQLPSPVVRRYSKSQGECLVATPAMGHSLELLTRYGTITANTKYASMIYLSQMRSMLSLLPLSQCLNKWHSQVVHVRWRLSESYGRSLAHIMMGLMRFLLIHAEECPHHLLTWEFYRPLKLLLESNREDVYGYYRKLWVDVIKLRFRLDR